MKISLSLKIERTKKAPKNEPMTPGQHRYFAWTGWSPDGHTKASAGEKIREHQIRRTASMKSATRSWNV